MADPRLPDYTHLVPQGALPDREVDLAHSAVVKQPVPEGSLHFASDPTTTACGELRAGHRVTDHRSVFDNARAGRLAAYRHVCDACQAELERTSGGAYRSRG